MIVDTHVHVIAPDRARYPLQPLGGFSGGPAHPWYEETPVSAEQMLETNTAAGVDRAILVQPFGAYAFDNAYHADSAAAHPDRFSSVCTVDPLAADAPERLRYWIRERGMHGLRLTTNRPGVVLDDPAGSSLWETIRDLAIPVCVLMSPAQLSAVRALADRYPTVPICLDHAAGIGGGLGQPDEATEALLNLAALPNVYLKVSSVNFTPLERAGEAGESLWRRIAGRFGGERLLWGTNYPVSQDGSYADMVRLGQRALPFLSDTDRELMLGGTAVNLWPALAGA